MKSDFKTLGFDKTDFRIVKEVLKCYSIRFNIENTKVSEKHFRTLNLILGFEKSLKMFLHQNWGHENKSDFKTF